MATAPTPGSVRQRDTAPSFTLVVDGEKHPLWFSEASARDVSELRKSYTRGGLMQLQQALSGQNGGMDLDDVAALLWLSRRQNGETTLAFDDVLDSITYDTKFEIELNDEDDAPEA